MKKKLIVVVNNHFDLMWRRCRLRPLRWQGRQYAPYSLLQQLYIQRNLELCQAHPDYAFTVECVAVLRQYLAAHPQDRDALCALARQGRLYLPATGYNIVDSNMILGESLVRNFLRGQNWLRQELGLTPQLAVRTDSFGNSAQLPQILRGFGIRCVEELQYTTSTGRYWVGLDGSCLLTATTPVVGSGGGWRKYAPCPDCLGAGIQQQEPCPRCGGTGLDEARADEDWSPIRLDEQALEESPVGLVLVGGEELLPRAETLLWAEQHRQQYDICFGNRETVLPLLEQQLAATDNPPPCDRHHSVELNPNNDGCFTSRIRTKQLCRRLEHLLLSTEALWAMGESAEADYPAAQLGDLWEQALLTMFHDAVTGTHVDAAYEELMEGFTQAFVQLHKLQQDGLARLCRPADNKLSVVNSLGFQVADRVTVQLPHRRGIRLVQTDGVPATLLERQWTEAGQQITFLTPTLPAFGAVTLKIEQDDDCIAPGADCRQLARQGRNSCAAIVLQDETLSDQAQQTSGQSAAIENQRYRIVADTHGVQLVWDKRYNRPLTGSGVYRPFELLLEEDIGSPWATLSSNCGRVALSPHTTLTQLSRAPGVQRLHFAVTPPQRSGGAIDGIQAVYTLSLWQDAQQIELSLEVNWDCYNQRLRMALPVAVSGGHRYEIPYGSLCREPYQGEFAGWSSANGDYPAIHWCGVESKDYSVAVFNAGTPSHRIEPGAQGDTILVSLLRSPTVPTFLHEPQAYSMTQWDGMRDAGRHSFSFAVAAYGHPLCHRLVVQEGYQLCRPPLLVMGDCAARPMPRLAAGSGVITACKQSEDGRDWILRLAEVEGKETVLRLLLPPGWQRAVCCDLQEQPRGALPIQDGATEIAASPFQIITLRLSRAAEWSEA